MNLLITDRAETRLRNLLTAIADFRPVVCVGPVKGGSSRYVNADGETISTPITSGWGVGFYDSSELAPDVKVVIRGIDFLVDERLNDKILDYLDGRFVLSDRSSAKG